MKKLFLTLSILLVFPALSFASMTETEARAYIADMNAVYSGFTHVGTLSEDGGQMIVSKVDMTARYYRSYFRNEVSYSECHDNGSSTQYRTEYKEHQYCGAPIYVVKDTYTAAYAGGCVHEGYVSEGYNHINGRYATIVECSEDVETIRILPEGTTEDIISNPDGSTTVILTVLNEDGSTDIAEETTFPDSTDSITKKTHISATGDINETISSVKTVTDEDGNTTEISETTSSSYDADGNLIDGEKTTVTTTDDPESSTPEKEEKETYNPETGQWECQATETSSCGGNTDDSNDPDNDNGDGTGDDSNGGGGGTPGCEEKTWYKDADGDGYSDGTTLKKCEQPTGYTPSAQTGDCNDNNSNINPGSSEICDNKDNNCNGGIDEGVKTTWYLDADNDGYYPLSGTTEACEAPADYKSSAQLGDCDDNNKQLNPNTTWYKDYDNDGYTDGATLKQCQAPSRYKLSAQANDCNDGDGAINPAAEELCDGINNNCKFGKDEGCAGSCSSWSASLSSTNITSGALFHDQALFGGLTLYYNSLNDYDGPLGNKWSHSYDIRLIEDGSGEVLYRPGSGKTRLYKPSDSGYTSQSGDYSTLDGHSGGYTITYKDGTVQNFNTAGQIASINDRNGNSTDFIYEDGHLSAVTDPNGQTLTFTTESNGKVSSISVSSGNSYNFLYDSDGNLMEVVYPSVEGSVSSWNYSYYDGSYLHTKTDLSGYSVTYSYDDEGWLVHSESSAGESYSVTYDQTNMLTEVTRPDGGTWQMSYDARLDEKTSETDPEGNVTNYEYDSDRNLISQTGSDGSTTSYTYDEYGNRTSETDATGNTTSYTYNQYGQVLSVTDAEGSKSSYTYDDRGNLNSATDASGASTSYEYDAKGNVTKITDATGAETHMVYDGSNNLVSVTDTSGATTFFAYDDAGNMTGQTNANGNTTTFEYNSLNQLIKVTDPQGKATSYIYDRSGNRTSQTDANGNATFYEYNHKGQVIKVTDTLGGETKYTYGGTSCSACGSKGDNLTSITDAKGNTTSFEYDHLSRLVKEVTPLGYSTSYSYDARGNLASKTDAEGNTISYSYDALGRLLAKSYPDNTGESYSYNSKGNLLTATNQNMGYSFTYDAGNRVTSVTGSNGRAISYSYDTSGRKTKMTGPNGEEIAYSYDESNRLSTIASDAGDFIFTYDSLGRRVGLSYPHGATASYSYDSSGRLVSIGHKDNSGNVIASNAYNHDNVGNRLTNESNTRTAVYQYDDIYRLNVANYTTPGFSTTKNDKGKGNNKGISNAIANQTEVYTYDPVGNRLTSQKNNVYSYNQANQLVTENGTTYTYDKNGNQIQKAGTNEFVSYFYNYENKLVKVERTVGDKVIVAEYKYDPFGRRIEKKVVENGATKVTKFFYDNEDILFEYDEGGNIGNRYVHGPGIDEPLALTNNKGNYYYHADGLGSIVALTNSQEKVVQDYDYYYFGKLKNQKNRIKQPYTYTAREYDRETGLYNYRVRYRDPDLGNFTQKDPIGFRGGINHYAYVQQNPVNFVDPYGNFGIIPGMRGNGPSWHHDRNQLQTGMCPAKEPVDDSCWSGEGELWTHGWFNSYRGEGSFTNYQCVYDSGGNLVTDPEFEGTYDISSPHDIESFIGHMVLDFVPWLLWGN